MSQIIKIDALISELKVENTSNPCRENQQAISALQIAKGWLTGRTAESYKPRPNLKEVAETLVNLERNDLLSLATTFEDLKGIKIDPVN